MRTHFTGPSLYGLEHDALLVTNLALSLFAFWRLNYDGDAYLCPCAQYQWSDAITFTLGGNMFFDEAPTFTAYSRPALRLRYEW